MQHCLRRLYSTIPEAAAVARTASTPRAVRLRRLRLHKRKHAELPVESDATPEGLTPTELARYKRELAKGNLMQKDGRDLSEKEWLDRLDARRSRVRGVREVVTEDGQKEEQVVGQKVYLPNILFRLVRNHTPPGQPYNPYEATFRIPQSVTKTDVRSYLLAAYGVKTTYIRTDNYLAPLLRDPHDYSFKRTTRMTYKRAVVGLVEPFYYPQAIEDMNKQQREERLAWLERSFRINYYQDLRQGALIRMSRAGSKGWKWRTGATANRGNILRIIAERRAARERTILETKNKIQESRTPTSEVATA
ncbi:uncharacterized protein FIBRA_00566 [Fibroporia radiculosa]|uniref:Large ribosomal subunit protein uL23m n=1 Tax=Fibroporia radiculosa TaxID=599839 RepID=J4I804_9APHY|nr:uncharacterized protein FIBRA_00566 [Fibroporia radiculosa]CCL98566.1 predicted protein [Fibroporia radiculosa]